MKNITIEHATLNKWLTRVIYALVVWKIVDIVIWIFKPLLS